MLSKYILICTLRNNVIKVHIYALIHCTLRNNVSRHIDMYFEDTLLSKYISIDMYFEDTMLSKYISIGLDTLRNKVHINRP